MPNPWINRPNQDPQAKIRLFCFPYAGAGSSIYHKWAAALPGVEVCLVNLPGRDARIQEPLQTALLPLVGQICEGMAPFLDRPFALFGHSMGGLLSFEVARQLRRRNAPQPFHLMISARRAPHLPDPTAHLWRLPETPFLTAIETLYGTLPAIIRQDPEVLNLFLSILRADFTMLGTYQYCEDTPLAIPISVFGGQQDPSVKEQDLLGWQNHTNTAFEAKLFPGDHFYFQKAQAAFFAVLRQHLTVRY
jgi:surfactin synthase thioesterase subunit